MENLRTRWDNLNTPVKVVLAIAAVALGGILLFRVFPYLIAALGIFGFIALLFVPYFLPTIVAFVRKHPSKLGIALVNLVFGWTFVGWIVSLVWALSNNSREVPQQTIIVNNNIAAATGEGAIAAVPPPSYQIGDIVNGHRFDGAQWVPLAPPAPPAPELIGDSSVQGEISWTQEAEIVEERRDRDLS